VPEGASVHALPGPSIGMCRRDRMPSGERVLTLEIEVRRPSTRQCGSRPNGVAWALSRPAPMVTGVRAQSAAATGVAGGTAHTRSPGRCVGVRACHDPRIAPGGSVEISFR